MVISPTLNLALFQKRDSCTCLLESHHINNRPKLVTFIDCYVANAKLSALKTLT